MRNLVLALLLIFSNLVSMAQANFDKQGHRGSRGLMPENTIPAMKLALDYGVTLEMDIAISKDKKVLVSHDPYISDVFALDQNGKEIPKGKGLKLYQMNYAEIKTYDVGSKLHPLFPEQKKLKVNIPLLEDLIDASEAYAKEKGYPAPHYNMETKITPKGDGELHPAPEEFVKRLMKVIKKKGIIDRLIIQSFDPRSLEIVHQKYPQVKTAYLVSKGSLENHLKDLSFKPAIYSPAYKLVTKEMIEACKKQGIKVIPWTINTEEEIEKLKELGVDGIISDYPNLF
ncbi:glycerophosphodiester phosphodiesterase [Pedobacter puniceum]|uniref:Glycerophosphodiester phosphodiesterase n=1 Tax=Pedobacter puniceum TaxID=2666136 RepID=A0A7K0FTB4_9SPHI|nr:glycerophosphodiester phosphodiesterase [Pedobacter puniceum]MRX48570.1 glycerophosphodiester phosphodiesterase [Pedobacter puniceum]